MPTHFQSIIKSKLFIVLSVCLFIYFSFSYFYMMNKISSFKEANDYDSWGKYELNFAERLMYSDFTKDLQLHKQRFIDENVCEDIKGLEEVLREFDYTNRRIVSILSPASLYGFKTKERYFQVASELQLEKLRLEKYYNHLQKKKSLYYLFKEVYSSDIYFMLLIEECGKTDGKESASFMLMEMYREPVYKNSLRSIDKTDSLRTKCSISQ